MWRAGSDGALSAPDLGKGYGLLAPPGTFPAGSVVRVAGGDPGPPPGAGTWVADPVRVIPDGQPSHPVLLTLATEVVVDPSRAVGVLWEKPDRIELLPVRQLAEHQLGVQVPHFSNVGILRFPSPQDLLDWDLTVAVGAAVNWLKDFLDVPYECPEAAPCQDPLDLALQPPGEMVDDPPADHSAQEHHDRIADQAGVEALPDLVGPELAAAQPGEQVRDDQRRQHGVGEHGQRHGEEATDYQLGIAPCGAPVEGQDGPDWQGPLHG
jgi:hypothetical protein